MKKHKRLSAGKIIALGFLSVILCGTVLLSLPVSHSGKCEVTFIDALFSAVSAVCVTGLITVDTGAAYSLFGQVVIALLLQIGGLGITSLGAGLIALMGGRLNQRENNLVKEALNYPTLKGIMPLIRSVLVFVFTIEGIGAVLSFFTFMKDYSVPRAIWYSVFHSIAAFNNGGFDVLGRGDSVAVYTHDVWFNLVTVALIVLGGFGFFAMREIFGHIKGDLRGERYSLHTKVVSMMTALLLVGGTVLLKITEGGGITWLGAMFASTTARTAGFATYPIGGFSNAGIVILCVLMFIGASPGSTGGGVKTTTIYALIKSLASYSRGREARSFGKKLKDEILDKAFIIVSLGVCWLITAVTVILVLEPDIAIRDVLFEVVSALSTTGLTTGITPSLGTPARLILIVTMYVGRLGPLTIATLWTTGRRSEVSRPEEDIPIG